MRERAMMFAAGLAGTLAVLGALLAGGAGQLIAASQRPEEARREGFKARAAEAGRLAAALSAQDRCAGLGTAGPPSTREAKRVALCQLSRAGEAAKGHDLERLGQRARGEGEHREEFNELARKAFESSEPFDSSRAAEAPTRALIEWQQAEIAGGRPLPPEASRRAEAGLERLRRAIQEELRSGRRADGGGWVFAIVPGAFEQARASGQAALAAYWPALYPESLQGAREMLAQGEPAGVEAMEERAEKWAKAQMRELIDSAPRASAPRAEPETIGP